MSKLTQTQVCEQIPAEQSFEAYSLGGQPIRPIVAIGVDGNTYRVGHIRSDGMIYRTAVAGDAKLFGRLEWPHENFCH